MTRTATRTIPARKTGGNTDLWLFDERELDVEERALLSAYRDASELIRSAAAQAPAVRATEGGDDIDAEATSASVRLQPSVPRFRTIANIDPAKLANLHGFLLAAGYLTTEVVGRSEGLCYRITREGLHRLSDETLDAKSA